MKRLIPADIVFLCLSIAACASNEKVRRGGEPVRTVREVQIAGNRHVSASAIIEGLATRPPSGIIFVERTVFDPYALEADRERIESFYHRQGFLSAKVTQVRSWGAGAGEVAVRIAVEEGEPARISSVSIQDAPEMGDSDEKALGKASGIIPGEIFVHETYLNAKDRIREALVASGYAFAKVTGVAAVSPDRRRVAVRFDLDAGPLVRFGQTRVEGLAQVPAEAVLGRLAWREGDVFDPRRVELTRLRLHRLGRFVNVRFVTDRQDRPEKSDVVIRVVEGSRHELRLGVGAGMDRVHYEVRGRIGYMLRGFLQPLTTLRLEGRPAYMFLPEAGGQSGFGGEASAAVERDDLLWPMLRAGVRAAYSAEELETYGIHGLRLNLYADRPFLGDRLTASIGWQWRFQSFLRIDPAVSDQEARTLGMTSPYRLGLFEQAVTWDLRDSPLETRSGVFFELRVEEGGAFAGGAFEYARVTPDLRGYLPLGARVVAAARARLGVVFAGRGKVPITQRYFAGGASSQRGFSQQRLAPFAVGPEGQTAPVGGEALFETSLEARVDLFQLWGGWLGLAAFLDGADVTRRLEDLDLLNLHWAAGAGIRYRTPIGPVRLDFGFRLNRTGAGEPDAGEHFAFHLSLGEAF